MQLLFRLLPACAEASAGRQGPEETLQAAQRQLIYPSPSAPLFLSLQEASSPPETSAGSFSSSRRRELLPLRRLYPVVNVGESPFLSISMVRGCAKQNFQTRLP